MSRALVKAGLAALLAAGAMAGGLAAQKLEVKAERDPEADFSAIRTYAVRPPPRMITNVAP